LAVGSEKGVCLWDTESWEAVRDVTVEAAAQATRAVAFSADGRMLAVAVPLGPVRLLTADGDRVLATLEAPVPSAPDELTFSSDGALLAVVGEIDGIQLWDLRRARQRLEEMRLDWQP
jgi:WD40 repeat protein